MEQKKLKKKYDVILHYNGLANIYDSLYSREQIPKIKMALKAVEMRDSDLVLDVGCGTGLLFDHIGDSAKLLVGLDISFGILKVAAERSKRLLKGSSISLIRADADHMPFPKEVFDKVFAVTLLQNMPDSDFTLGEIMRVAKKNSAIIVTGLKKSFTKEGFARILSSSGLRFFMLKTGEEVRCYIAICRKDVVKFSSFC